MKNAAPALKPELTQEEFDRIDAALAAVLEDPAEFGDWLADFAARNAERLETHSLRTHWSDKQWEVVISIERIQRGEPPSHIFPGRSS